MLGVGVLEEGYQKVRGTELTMQAGRWAKNANDSAISLPYASDDVLWPPPPYFT